MLGYQQNAGRARGRLDVQLVDKNARINEGPEQVQCRSSLTEDLLRLDLKQGFVVGANVQPLAIWSDDRDPESLTRIYVRTPAMVSAH